MVTQYNVLPALQVRQPNFASALQAAEQIKSNRLRNRLMTARSARAQAAELRAQEVHETKQIKARQLSELSRGIWRAERRGTPAELGTPIDDVMAPGEGEISEAETARIERGAPPRTPRLNPAAMMRSPAFRAMAAIDIDSATKTAQLINTMGKAETDQFAARNKVLGGALQRVLSLPEEQRPLAYRQALGQLAAQGFDLSRVAPTFEQGRAENRLAMIKGADALVKEEQETARAAAKVEAARVKSEGEGKKGLASAKSEILPGGATIQIRPDGKVIVTNALGAEVTGDERAAVLVKSRLYKMQELREAAGQKKAGAATIAMSVKVIERLGGVQRSIGNIDRAIAAIDAGAKTGAIMSKLPSIRAASIELDNVQKAMGLDVIGTTTFGALSKGELDLALSKALPTRLKPADLRAWLVEKKAAQEKLAVYLEDAAMFLGTPGNTPANWVSAQREARALAERKDYPRAVNKAGEELIWKDGKWQKEQ